MPEPASQTTSVDVSSLDAPGRVLMVDVPGYEDAFIARVRCASPPPGSVPAGGEGEYLVAFSRLCTHMGAYLLGSRHGSLESIAEEGVVRCPAHLTCFDLCRDGLVVVGQACSKLPRIELRAEAPGRVRLAGWSGLSWGEVDP